MATTPVDPLSGLPLSGWSDHGGYHVDDIQQLAPEAVGVLLGPISGGLLAIDFDGPGSEAKFQEMYGRPSSDLPNTLAWSSGRTERRQEAFVIDRDWWDVLQGGQSWRDEHRRTVLELRWKGQQSAFAGAHPETSGYFWLDGCSPREFPEPAMAPDWLLMPFIRDEPSPSNFKVSSQDSSRALAMLACLPPGEFSNYWPWLKVGMALHSVDPEMLDAWVEWSSGMLNFNEDQCRNKWVSSGKGRNKLTVSSLYFWAKQHGYKPSRQNHKRSLTMLYSIKRAGGVCADVGKIQWSLPGFAATGLVLLAAETGTGKTTLLYRAAEAIQEGTLFLEEVPARQGAVRYLSAKLS